MSLKNLKSRFQLSKFTYSVKFWVIFIVFLIVLLIYYYVLMDIYTPYTSDAYIQAYVLQVAPQVDGQVVNVYVKNNDYVHKGQQLFGLDARPYEYQVQQLRAKLVQTRQNIDQLNSNIKAAEQLVKQSQADYAYATKRYNDLLPLAKKNYIAKLQLDQATEQVNSKKAILNQSKADYEKAKQAIEYKIDGDYAIIKEAEANLSLAEYNLSQTTFYATTDGYVTNLQLVVGSYIKTGDAVLTLVDDDQWWVVANFRENSVGRIREGQTAEVSVALYPGKIFKAVVESADWGVSSGQGIPSGDLPVVESDENWVQLAQRFPVRLRITNIDHDEYKLRIGGSVTVAVFTGESLILNPLAKLWLRIGSLVDYLY
jgi:multidrug resistance efflux pump